MAKYTNMQRLEAAANIREIIRRGQTLYTVTRKTAYSGASRIVAVFHVDGGEVYSLNRLVGPLLGWPILSAPTGEGVKVRNGYTGVDLVGTVSLALFDRTDALNAVEL